MEPPKQGRAARRWNAYLTTTPKKPSLQGFSDWVTLMWARYINSHRVNARRLTATDRDRFEAWLEGQAQFKD